MPTPLSRRGIDSAPCRRAIRRALRIGIGINTGVVIAGTIGGGGKLEFTLIGDTVNVAARVEQLTKTTGDAILLTQQCVDALASRPLDSSTGDSMC